VAVAAALPIIAAAAGLPAAVAVAAALPIIAAALPATAAVAAAGLPIIAAAGLPAAATLPSSLGRGIHHLRQLRLGLGATVGLLVGALP
jgi:hypothetical protein